MTRRGRPPHPDILTPREWDVLTLVREGLTNPQIAERLGITMDAAKYHVSEILSKLGVETREEAAAWEPRATEEQVLRPSWASALMRWWPALAWAASAVVVAGLALLLYGVLKSDDSAGDAVSASITPAPSASSAPSPSPGLVQLTTTDPIALPPSLSIILETGCCETQLSGLVRVTRSADGTSTRAVLFAAGNQPLNSATGIEQNPVYFANGVTLPTPNPLASPKSDASDQPYISTYGVSADARAMVVGLCVVVRCLEVNGARGVDGGITRLYRSLDGGDTWSELKDVGLGASVQGVTSSGRILISNPVSGSKDATYNWEPDGQPVTPPVEQSGAPTVLADGRLIWGGPLGALYFDDGRVLQSGSPSAGFFFDVMDLGDGRFAVPYQAGISIVDGETNTQYRVPGLFNVGAYLGGDRFVGLVTIETQEVPAIIDLAEKEVTPITTPFLDEGFDYAQFLVLAGAVNGPSHPAIP